MTHPFLMELSLFIAKCLTLVIAILLLLIGMVSILGRHKIKLNGKVHIKNLNKKLKETKIALLEEIYSKENFKAFLKNEKITKKSQKKQKKILPKNMYVLNFHGDLKASCVSSLREEVTAILSVATSQDEVVVRLESAGGMVNAYGLAAAQLERIRQQKIPLTISIDKIAASGGYLMACIANKILAAPFAIIGSIGVIAQLPNFHRLLKEKNIDFEQLTAGSFKRTLTMFGKNTEEGRNKMQHEIEEIHLSFKNLIQTYRNDIDIEKVSTGEYWLGSQAIELKLIDHLQTSDDYLLHHANNFQIFEISHKTKKTFSEKLFTPMSRWMSDFIR